MKQLRVVVGLLPLVAQRPEIDAVQEPAGRIDRRPDGLRGAARVRGLRRAQLRAAVSPVRRLDRRRLRFGAASDPASPLASRRSLEASAAASSRRGGVPLGGGPRCGLGRSGTGTGSGHLGRLDDPRRRRRNASARDDRPACPSPARTRSRRQPTSPTIRTLHDQLRSVPASDSDFQTSGIRSQFTPVEIPVGTLCLGPGSIAPRPRRRAAGQFGRPSTGRCRCPFPWS